MAREKAALSVASIGDFAFRKRSKSNASARPRSALSGVPETHQRWLAGIAAAIAARSEGLDPLLCTACARGGGGGGGGGGASSLVLDYLYIFVCFLSYHTTRTIKAERRAEKYHRGVKLICCFLLIY